ncbi:MAG: hypothetical protein ACLQPH_09970 [Acidimicrobiales bacterium]
MSETSETPAGEDELELVEIEAEGVDENGNLVEDDLVVAVDRDGSIVAADETIMVVTPDGDAVIDETISVAGDDGELHAIEEDVSILEADGEA